MKHLIIIFISIILITFISCGSKDDSKPSNEQNKQIATENKELNTPSQKSPSDMASVNLNSQKASDENPSAASVLEISMVYPSKPGYMVDFEYSEDSKTKKFSDLVKGKTVFLNFWGTWCPPCRREIPEIIKLTKDYENKNLIVVGIVLEKDPKNIPERVRSFVKKSGINYVNFIGGATIAKPYGGINSVPTTFIIDKLGEIQDAIVGSGTLESFTEAVNKVMKK